MAAKRKKRRQPRDSRGRFVKVKAHCRRPPESRLAKRDRINRSMPF